MGGPCMCNGKAVAPGTDNFELVPFELNGVQYHSAEQAYQAIKMRKEADRAKVARCVPKPGEKAWDHGMRAWQAGQLGTARKDWEAVKVEAMYIANKAKLEQNPDVLMSLLRSNGDPKGKITHMGSGKFWDKWNPIILMLLREELSPDGGDAPTIHALRSEMDTYRVAKKGKSIFDEFTGDAENLSPGAEATAIGAAATEVASGDCDGVPFGGNILQLFRHLDVEGTGKIHSADILSVLAKVDASWTQDRVDRVLESADLSTESVICYEELISRIFLDACNQLSSQEDSNPDGP
eukprot:TRINITY_DN83293_c0_g1_i1.p1 TRINITY_DN83293_c0_g1~~TRINITY_DN83293_c0_g1_i1.p1  ORF type:complete len:294 (+),score=48.44 TRINITY_DN83293_c0_g1_i1:97-978(+)